MKQFLLPKEPDGNGVVRLTGRDFHYLVHVRRIRAGLVFKALLPDGRETRVLAQAVEKDALVCECLSPELEKGENSLPRIALFQALPKGAKIDQIIRQATEIGVSEIAPFVSAYTVARPDADGGETGGKTERQQRLVREARQQSGSAVDTVVRPVCSFGEILEYWESVKRRYRNPVGILLHQDPLAKGSFHEYLKGSGFDTPHETDGGSSSGGSDGTDQAGGGARCGFAAADFAAAAVGPEGGFSSDEARRFLAAGFKPLVLGKNILRVETAAIYAVSVIQTILMEGEEWMPKTRSW
jgi:16S rRNA (uracil1498-N3)-methyltransferase